MRRNDNGVRKWEGYINEGRWVEVEQSSGGVREVPDPLWQEIDRGGHIHKYVVREGVLLVPGLAEVRGRLYCKRCEAVVSLGKLPPLYPPTRRGDWIINGEVVDVEAAEYVLGLLGRM
jgi:hypothetical protein